MAIIDLAMCKAISSASLPHIKQHCSSTLRQLYLFQCRLVEQEAIIDLISATPLLTHINLQGIPKMTDELGKKIATLTQLKFINCRGAQFSDSVVCCIASGCTNLKTLILNGCPISSVSCVALAQNNCHQLTHLGLGECPMITDHGIQQLSQHCTKLKILDISSIGKTLSDNAFVHFASSLQNLEILDISTAGRIRPPTLIPFITLNGINIKILNVAQCRKIGDGLVTAIGNYCPNLIKLVLNGCTRITDTGIEAVASGCSELQEIQVSGCSLITDTSTVALVRSCPNLNLLNFSQCFKLTDESLTAFTLYLTNIRTINLAQCKSMTALAVQQFILAQSGKPTQQKAPKVKFHQPVTAKERKPYPTKTQQDTTGNTRIK